MLCDVCVRERFTDKGNMVLNITRVHDSVLSEFVRAAQDNGGYIMFIRLLFRKKEVAKEKDTSLDELDVEKVDG